MKNGSKHRTKARLAVAALAVGGLGVGACHAPPEAALEAPQPVRAAVATAERQTVDVTVELRGTVEAENSSAVASRVMAAVTAVHVEEGDRVEVGQLLVTIAPQVAEGGLSQARGALAQAQAAAALARRNHERFVALAATDAASELELDVARSQMEQTAGAVEQAEGAVAAAREMVSDTRMTAPFAGRVARRMVDVGALAAPGRPLLELDSDASRRLALAVPEGVLSRSGLRVGDTLPVRLDARPVGEMLEGTVAVVGATADPATHTVRVEVLLPVDEAATGGAGRAWVRLGSRDAVLVPRAAVMARGGLELVAVRTEEGVSSTRVVTTGGARGDRIEVLSGLEGGETVLVGPAAPPPAGAPVEVEG